MDLLIVFVVLGICIGGLYGIVALSNKIGIIAEKIIDFLIQLTQEK